MKEMGIAVPVVELNQLGARADVVVECLPPECFEDIARPAVSRGRTLLISSVGQLLLFPDLVEIARNNLSRILVPSGALAGLDGVRACAESTIHSARLISRKPPRSFANVAFVRRSEIRLDELNEPVKLFEGNAAEAIARFPANANVAVALALAGIGPQRTAVEIWADPSIDRNVHRVEVESELGRLTVTVEAVPSVENAGSSRFAGPSLIATLRKLTTALVVGT
jgi:aspartate dehydrogenase